MMNMLTKSRAALFGAVSAVMALAALSFSSLAGALAPEYGKLTEGVTSEFNVIVPIVLVALGTLVGIAFAIRWGVRKFGGIH